MTSKLEVQRIRFDKTFFSGLTEIERRVFLLCGQVVFELNVLNKLRLWGLGYIDDPHDLNRHATIMQSEYLARLLGGTIFEAWEALRKTLHHKDAQHIVSSLPQGAAESHSRLKRSFGKGTTLGKVRNEIAFHFDAQKLAECLNDVVESDPDLMELILGGTLSNNIPAVSMYTAWFSLSRKYHSSDIREGLEAFTKEVFGVLPDVVALAEGAMMSLIERELGNNWGSVAKTEVIENVPLTSEIRIPFFSRSE